MTRPTGALRRGRALPLVALVLGLAVPVAPSRAITFQACGAVTDISGGKWSKVRAPDFPAGPAAITAYAVHPRDPELMYATNGTAVVRSINGGCNWEQSLQLTPTGAGDVALSSTVTKITGIALSAHDSAFYRVVLTAVEVDGPVGRPHVLVSNEGVSGTYDMGDAGLPAAGVPTKIRIAPSNPNAVYLAIRSVPATVAPPPTGLPGLPPTPIQPGKAIGALYRSSDGGRTWTPASDGGDFSGAPEVEDFAIDPATSKVVWVVAGGLLRKSVDSGKTYTDAGLSLGTQQDKGYEFTAVTAGDGLVAAFSRTMAGGGARALVSTDNGATFKERNVPQNTAVRSVARTGSRTTLILGTVSSGGADIHRYSTTKGSSRSAAPPEASTADYQVSTDLVSDTVYGFTPTGIYRTRPDDGTPGIKPLDPPRRGPFRDVVPPTASLTPKNRTIHIEIGKTGSIDYKLDLPRHPTPLDVYLIIDNSQSMLPFIEGVRRELTKIINGLVDQGISVHAGLGYYQTTQDPPMYDRLAPVREPGPQLFSALARLQADSEGTDEPTIVALHQAALGTGIEKFSFLPLSTCDINPDPALCTIPKDRHADFVRAHAMRVFVHATDEKFIRNLAALDDSQEPTFEEAAAAMRSRRIHHVGVYPGEESKNDLREMSRLTGTVAPAGGVECGGVRLAAGEPLVCPVSNRVAKTLIQVLNAIRDEQPLSFVANRSPVLAGLTPASIPRVNVKARQLIPMRATFSCVDQPPSEHEVTIEARINDGPVRGAQASVRVICGAPLIPPIVQNPPGNNPPPGRENPAPAPAQPAPAIPIPQVNPAPQTQPQVQAQANLQAGAAEDEQEEFQVATASLDVRREAEGVEQLAMVGLASTALLGAACAGFAASRAQRTALAHARARRR